MLFCKVLVGDRQPETNILWLKLLWAFSSNIRIPKVHIQMSHKHFKLWLTDQTWDEPSYWIILLYAIQICSYRIFQSYLWYSWKLKNSSKGR